MPFIQYRTAVLIALLAICPSSLHAQSRTVAITFDDLPLAGQKNSAQVRSINSAILKALDEHHAPATGFVIGQSVEDVGREQGLRILEQWVRHGYDLGNHSFSHPDFNALTVEEFEQDLIADEAVLKPLVGKVGKPLRYMRFPYNHTGDTPAKHDAIAGFLKQRGYQVATCTIDNEDYLFNWAYLQALADNDPKTAHRVRDEYLAYTSAEIDYYNGLHKQVFGREIAQVMLLHDNRLNADVIDKVLAMFEEKQYRFVTLDAAQRDPAYQTTDVFVTKNGWMWGYRWARELGVKVDGRLETEPADWIRQYGQGQAKQMKR
jgi:peptidoglycan/xylan/chitin deacetylase (PgdA/CDA1 family)